ncbi:hypothetical protein GL50803_003666 [Giardia duodenalis]|uniref:Uncharacterized protein n=1 Tax=Giardia intestinalis (strain ATCC 50803 / WB clone C6) TaxID=184922 RepID=A8BF57_GIAIC|nr:hypothetical protein GL50803_003666 [Giardia intestinalis]KAE8305702.1 hypothetical protein GL50803_003666 [Giardia intestinalis]|eukprot:XP_001707486.1 Hypothetical protein GL50803_3666 [Giardia lamblia ATCC 50803]
MTRRIQCGGSSLEIDPLTGELSFEDFLNTAEPPEQDPMPVPKIDVGGSLEILNSPIVEAIFGDVLDKLDLFKKDVDAFIAMLKQKTKNAINWGLALVGVTTVSGLMVVMVREITMAIKRWQRTREYQDSQQPEAQPKMISKENMEKKDEISEISGEDVEPPSLGEYEEQVYDENGNAMLNPDGSPLTKTVVIPLDRDISDQYDPIPEPDDISEEEEEIEEDEVEEEPPIKITDELISDIFWEFDKQPILNEENFEFLYDSGVYIIHIPHVYMKRTCKLGGDYAAYPCKMIESIIGPALWDRYGHTFKLRFPNCSHQVSGPMGTEICCKCHMNDSVHWRIRVIPDDQPIWYNNDCTCGANCSCRCHTKTPESVFTVTYNCVFWCVPCATRCIYTQYESDCWTHYNFSTDRGFRSESVADSNGFSSAYIIPAGKKIIRYESENKNYPYNSRECCDFCKVMKNYFYETEGYKLHRTNTEVYIFFSRGENSTIFEKCNDLFNGYVSQKIHDLLSDWDAGNNKIMNRLSIDCKCDVKRPRCTDVFRGLGEVHADTVGFLKGHAQKVKWIYLPDYDSNLGLPWWYDDPHDYQSISKVCAFEGFLERNIPEHVIRFYSYRRLTDKKWFGNLYKQICDAILLDYPDMPAGIGAAAQKWKDFNAWKGIDKMLSDVVPVKQIYPEQVYPETRLFTSKPANWNQLKQRGASWTGEVEPELASFKRYLDLLNKYYPGWWEFRETQELGWWDNFWTQIPDLRDLERTSIFYYEDLTIDETHYEIYGEPPWWRSFWGPTIRDKAPDPERPRTYEETVEVASRY